MGKEHSYNLYGTLKDAEKKKKQKHSYNVYGKRCRIAKKDPRKSYKVEGITLPDFKLYYKSIAIKSLWYWCKDRKIDQWNRIGNPEISPNIITLLRPDKGAKNTQCRKTMSAINRIGIIE